VISKTVLVLAEGFGEGMDADRVAREIGRGLSVNGRLECDLCPLDEQPKGVVTLGRGHAQTLRDGLDFDRRMRAARALVIACGRLDDHTLPGSVTFEAATRARQAGVPTYAVTAHNDLDPFEARIVDLQIILKAGTGRGLGAAGRKLARLVS
jgi:glycerate kinase